jgi:anaerobic magnesium-protoporphyrin IX monomethyl ester cyclase
VAVGLESASDTILASMKKRITRQQIKRAIEAAESVGIGIQGNFIFGDPAETVETMQETLEFCQENNSHVFGFGTIIPFPATPIFEDALQRGVIPSKKIYYESLHETRLYNMTSIPDKIFSEVYDHGYNGYSNLLKYAAIDKRAFIVERPAKDFDEFSRGTFVFRMTCPSCGESMDRIMHYYADLNETQGILDFITKHRSITCSGCFRLLRLVLSDSETKFVFVCIGDEDIPSFEHLTRTIPEDTPGLQT